MKNRYLITSALPYANGPLHFGHLAGAYIPADIYVRHLRLQGKKTMFISGSDEHGVAIMLNAKKAGKDYKEYVNEWNKDHAELFKMFDVEFDFFGQTSEPYHYDEVEKWFHLLNDKGYIGTKESKQLYCNDCKNHLPDRFVEGTCYECGYEKARGDECPNCGIWIEPERLKSPTCQICKSKNVEQVSVTQYYLLLSKFSEEFRTWFETKKEWRKTVFPYVDSLTKEGLKDRAITRDLDWGIDVPLPEAKGKKLYVWFDAPIGYVSNTKQFLKESGSKEDYLSDWWNNSDTEIVNFIGKDNIIFHGVIFPMMSMASGRVKAVTNLPANQYVNLEGKQFSKSQGHYVDAREALSKYGVDALRYALIHLIPENADTSFTFEGLEARVNNELANNIGNLVSRALKFSLKNWAEGMEANAFNGFATSEFGQRLSTELKEHAKLLDEVTIRRGIEKVMEIGQLSNNFFSECAPWAQVKVDVQAAAKTIAYSSMAIAAIGVLFAPYLPTFSEKILKSFAPMSDELKKNIYSGNLQDLEDFMKTHPKLETIPEMLVPKIEKAKVV